MVDSADDVDATDVDVVVAAAAALTSSAICLAAFADISVPLRQGPSSRSVQKHANTMLPSGHGFVWKLKVLV